MSPRRKTQEEEDAVLESIEVVAKNLSEQVNALQGFISELKASRAKEIIHPTEREQV